MKYLMTAALAALTLAACGDKTETTTPAAAEAEQPAATVSVTITDARVRRPLDGKTLTAGFMVITATGPDRLVSASSPVADKIELHTMTLDDEGVMRMRQVEGYDVSADEALTLAPGGNHLMIFGVGTDDIQTAFPLDLVFEKAGTIRVNAELFSGMSNMDHGDEH